ncbi:MAG: hypothetical protein KUG75_04080 [Pseudomonadales bacterium]|nr:hypothetical protein [Pseudomonadales bacterium]
MNKYILFACLLISLIVTIGVSAHTGHGDSSHFVYGLVMLASIFGVVMGIYYWVKSRDFQQKYPS